MNERIFELCIQAKREFDEHVVECELLGKQIEWVTEERLVELVVRECMKESWDEIIPDEDIEQEYDPLIREYLKGINQGIVDAVIRFRNHFGVKE